MIRRKLILETWLTLLNFGLPSLAAVLTLLARFHGLNLVSAGLDRRAYFVLIISEMLAWGFFSWYYQLGKLEYAEDLEKRLIKANLLTTTVLFAFTFTYRSAAFSRGFVWLFPVVLFCLAYLTQRLVHLTPYMSSHRYPVAVIGSGSAALSAAAELAAHPFFFGRIEGFVALPNQTIAGGEAKVLNFECLSEVVTSWNCQEVYIAIGPAEVPLLAELQEEIQALCLPTRMIIGAPRHPFVKQIYSIGGLEVVNLYQHPVDCMRYILWKRAFDLLFSTGVLILTAPLLVLIGLAIKLSSRGPIFFKQERIGFNNRPFTMLKFRTMCVQADEESNTKHTFHADPRITAFGRLLRRTSFDELPQFLNVLRGEMSVVGPRPELTFFVQKFREEIPSYLFRHHVMCGITGWAQVNGYRGSHTSIPTRIEYDLEYVRNWSLSLDLQIIAKTLFTGFSKKNAF